MGMIKVLWIDDECNTNIGASFKENASVNDIEIIGAEDLRSGEEIIRKNSNEIHAVILDCFCKIEKNGIEDDGEFLKQALAHGSSIHKYPWFIMSAGAVKGDIKHILKYGVNRPLWMDENEEMYYDKIADTDKLFDDIKRIVSNWDVYMIQEMYQDVFSCINENKLFLRKTKDTLIRILSALHFPDKHEFCSSDNYNSLRKVVEYIFRWCHYNGLLPDECIENGHVNIWDSYNYLSGKGMKNRNIRYGKQAESVLPKFLDKQFQQIVYLCQDLSHSDKNTDFETEQRDMRQFIENQSQSRSIFALTLIIIETIKYLQNFFDNHSKEENQSKIYHLNNVDLLAEKYLNKTFPTKSIEIDDDGILHFGECKIMGSPNLRNATFVTLIEVSRNTDTKDQKKYPIYGRYRVK